MTKFFIFLILLRLVGNPILAILIFLILVYVLDRRYVGMLPSLTKPFKRRRSIAKLRLQIAASPYDVSSKRELARLLIERRQYGEASRLLEESLSFSEESAEFWADYGQAAIGLGRLEEGEQRILKAFELNERVQYGQPYLKLAEAYRSVSPAKALQYAEHFRQIQSSSIEAYYLLGRLYQSLGRKDEARAAYEEALLIYRQLPKYKKRQERGDALRSYLKKMFL
ncbi:tetratricopeptide repeat protein [Paenibacillus pinistramenti]|uniref:tetratricopeptide repeat protein n=1 Tax=Paenibacillus pinistramenti TaxID=1768003 RepID=UPI0011095F1C|nr:tetratricopeptide repeat protein [Paenibacillus pinistramenti]